MQLKEVIEKLVAEKCKADFNRLVKWTMYVPPNETARNIYSTITGVSLEGFHWVTATHEIIDSWINILEAINEEDS